MIIERNVLLSSGDDSDHCIVTYKSIARQRLQHTRPTLQQQCFLSVRVACAGSMTSQQWVADT
jgi:hypothetical protein